VDVAKRKYSVAQIMALIRKPKPENWPDHATPMPPMPQVSNADAKKIAEYIKSLETVK
jgi:cytochrome c1